MSGPESTGQETTVSPGPDFPLMDFVPREAHAAQVGPSFGLSWNGETPHGERMRAEAGLAPFLD